MRYLFVIPALNAGGAERVMVTLANELVLQDIEITILTLNSSESFYAIDDAVKVHGLKLGISKRKFMRMIMLPLVEMKRLIEIGKFTRRYKPDAVLSFLFTTNVLTIILHFFNRVPLVVSERNDPTSYSKWVGVICKMLYPFSNVIVCQGNKVGKFFSNAKTNQIRIIPNPIDEDSIPALYQGIRRKNIAAVGRLVPQKNFELLIDSFSDISKEYPDYTLEIYGEGYLKDRLEKKIGLLNLGNQVKLMGTKKNVMHYINDSKLFIMSSNFEGFPNVLMEAMSSGLPVVSTDFASGIAREHIQEYHNGLLVPVQNRDALTEAIANILKDDELQKLMSKNNRTIINKFNSKIIASKWNEVLTDLVERRRKSAAK